MSVFSDFISANTFFKGIIRVGIIKIKRREYSGCVEDVYRVGICYLKGTGVAKDEHEGFLWLEQAAECDHPAAMYAVSQCYEYGKGVQKDQNKAQELYKKAADNKNSN